MPTLPRLDRVSDTEGEHSDDSAGEKEAKRQRSEPTTPVSTSGRLPYEYDALMGITKVGTKEVEGFGEELDTSEYHDAAEEPTRRDESDNTVEPQRLSDFQGGYGSSSLKECIELLNTTSRIAPAPLDSGDGQKDATLKKSCKVVERHGKSLKMVENLGKFTMERGSRRKGVLQDLPIGSNVKAELQRAIDLCSEAPKSAIVIEW